ncbi:MAG: hypothetical protein HY815_03730, partial [Candidatus Riflebacteria bacterium]|nr:hypothetical protein [Candidatus Riflebacteria bacterium]
MGGRSTIQLLVAALLFSWTAGASYSELRITGTKDFQYRSFSVTGSLNQFLVDFPTFLTDRGFTQSLRLNVTGTVLDNVSVDVSLDDTNDIEKDRKLLVRADGKAFSLTAGRLTLEAPQTRYLLFNKKALALVGTYRKGRHEVTGLVGRPEGESTRDFFKGRGSQQEYLLRNRPVVQGSEIVQLDGRLLVRGSDYEFDFEEGTLILNRRLLPVEPTSTLTVEYEGTGNGSLFKTTVVGLRERYRLAPCKGRKTGPQTPDRVGVSVVMSQDEVPSAAGSPTTTRSPERLTLVGADLFSELSPGWIVSGEVATSIQQTDLRLDSSATVRGTACDVALGHKGGRLDLRLAHQYLGPGFQAVGKREFVRLGEVNDLSSNLRLTTFNSRFDLTRSLFLDSLAEVSRTNPSHDPAVTRRDFTAVGNVLTLNLGPDSRIAVRHRDDLDDQSRPGAPPVKVTHRVRSGAITRPIAGLVAQVRAETASDRGSDPTAGDTTSLALSLGDSRSKRVKWTVNAQNVSQVSPAALPVRDALTLSGMADLAWSRSTSGSLAVMNRREKDRLLGSEDVVNTGEIRGRYQPSDRFTVNVKTAAEERSRILRVITDPRMAQ